MFANIEVIIRNDQSKIGLSDCTDMLTQKSIVGMEKHHCPYFYYS